LTSSSLTCGDRLVGFSSPRLYGSGSFGTSRSTFDDPCVQPRGALVK
jgi:hypothetical protein